MEEAILKLIVTVPAAAAVIVTAWLFLRAQRDLNTQWQDTVKQIAKQSHEDRIKMSSDMHSDRAETKKVVLDNTRAMVLVAERLGNVKCSEDGDR